MVLKNINFEITFNYYRMSHKFVPKYQKASVLDVLMLQNFINENKNILVLTGAGISTESGLPDYRSKDVGLYNRNANPPIQYNDFISSHNIRKRYWARNYLAWNNFSSSQPNKTHLCLAQWEKRGFLNYVVTQNVDRLHHKAGSERIIELHGTSYIVKCLKCNYQFSRYILQNRLMELNPTFKIAIGEIRPDADVDVDSSYIDSFNIVNCDKCGGILKPSVIFFGETVPKDVVFDIYSKIQKSDALLVLGSSLEVYSGYRFVVAASEQDKPIGIINIGKTRADPLAKFKISTACSKLLSKISF